ncbi:DUF3231 family protein [Bacillus sp. FSL K6-4563]|uniref:DUF3231 family protein n=1 Tax=Bacillus TaxID=1386 RepID=UPI00017A6000|nr:DUF3231 family protein [Bacillus pumilus]EDW22074.1 conserved hypothetical protein [Bacillus pumilus ATCC 7061]MCR4355016.1 DUF3231 family protein [Bacillus pumilus]MCY7505770.1 DUF3231 family protein [Bacillus pumilus]MDR4271874.1 DUF3231 family protein [Bacillus pumilus]MED4628761.1 DUF3231 family protein [Bacillus pumilus]
MGILSGNPTDEPMHYGEVFGTWSYLMVAKSLVAGYQTHLNHAGDEDLQKLIEEAIQGAQQEIKEIETLLKENGIGLPPTPPERPKACIDDIPVGARFQDPEIAAGLSANIASGLVSCSTIMGQSIREDIAMMFGQFHTQKAAFGAKVLRLNKEKGWLIPPPLHHSKAEDC